MRADPFTSDAGTVRIDRSRRAFVRLAGAAAFVPFVSSAAARPEGVGTVRSDVEFDPAAGELPEGITFGDGGNTYVTLNSGEIRR